VILLGVSTLVSSSPFPDCVSRGTSGELCFEIHVSTLVDLCRGKTDSAASTWILLLLHLSSLRQTEDLAVLERERTRSKSDAGDDALDLDSSAVEIDLGGSGSLLEPARREKSLEKRPRRLDFLIHRPPWRDCSKTYSPLAIARPSSVLKEAVGASLGCCEVLLAFYMALTLFGCL
jgi:hypothetical protein